MARSKLDKIDKNILKYLQDDGRVTNIKLAQSVGISAPPCLRRVRALEEAGYINGYNAKINAALLNYGVTVYAMVQLKSQADHDLASFEKYIAELPMVRECYMLAGEVDFLLKIVAKNSEDYQKFHTNHLTAAPNVISVKSSIAIRSVKSEPGIPIE